MNHRIVFTNTAYVMAIFNGKRDDMRVMKKFL